MFKIVPNDDFVKMLENYGNNNKVYAFKTKGKFFFIGYAIDNSDWTNVKVKFASYATKGKKKSNVYYFDTLLNSLGCNVAEVDTYVQKALNIDNADKSPEQSLNIDSINKLQSLVTDLQSNKVDPKYYIDGICNLLLCECSDYFSNNPYLDGHTAELNIGAGWDYREASRKIVTIVKDKEDNLKNVIDNRVFHISNYSERLSYLDTIRNELLSRVC